MIENLNFVATYTFEESNIFISKQGKFLINYHSSFQVQCKHFYQ